MVRLERIRTMDGNRNAVVDLQVSTVAELPELYDTSLNMTIRAGSIAQCIQNGKFYTLDETGTWYDQDGNAAE